MKKLTASFEGEAILVIVKEVDKKIALNRDEVAARIGGALAEDKRYTFLHIEWDNGVVRAVRKVEYKKTMALRENKTERQDFEAILRKSGAKDFGLYVSGFSVHGDEVVID